MTYSGYHLKPRFLAVVDVDALKLFWYARNGIIWGSFMLMHHQCVTEEVSHFGESSQGGCVGILDKLLLINMEAENVLNLSSCCKNIYLT